MESKSIYITSHNSAISVSETKTKTAKSKEVKSAPGKAVYEVGYLVMPSVSPELLPREVDAIKSAITKAGGEILSEGSPEMRQLAYTMIKPVGATRPRFDSAYFGWVKFEGERSTVAEVKKSVDAMEHLIRSILVETVRDNTLYGPRFAKEARDRDSVDETKEPAKIVEKSSEEEIDKAVEKLIG